MSLSQELIAKFVKVTNDSTKPQTETTLYGTITEYAGELYVKLDGSNHLTPLSSMESTADIGGVKANDRVTVMIKNHTATITGNLTAPSVNTNTLNEATGGAADRITKLEALVADKVSTDALIAVQGRINSLETNQLTVNNTLNAQSGVINDLMTYNVTVQNTFTAHKALIDDLGAKKIDASVVQANYASIEKLESIEGDFHKLESTYASFSKTTTDTLTAIDGTIKNLDTKYANIDFANIGEAAIKKFYSTSGIIKNLTVSNGTYTGELAGVKISGDLITANTVVADKLVIKGTNGLYYKLNTDGMKTEAEQTEYNSLNGSVILAKSITAEKISVSDLVAFGATIGGFHITDNSLYSGVKSTVGNTTRGIYLDSDGQVSFGGVSNYVKYFKDADDAYKLVISAKEIVLNGGNLSSKLDNLTVQINDIEIGGRNYIATSDIMFAGSAATGITPSIEGDVLKVVCTSGNGNWHSWPKKCFADTYLRDGDKFTFSMDLKCEEGSVGKPKIYFKSGLGYYALEGELSTEYRRVHYTGVWKSENSINIHFGWNESSGTYYIRRPKLEKGSRPTAWSLAPEDTDDSVANAAKTATNYLSFGSSGLVVGDMTASTLGNNVLIDSNSVDIRNGTATLASFGADHLYLAKNSRNAKIDLCNGLATLYHQSKYSYDTLFVIDTPNATEIMGTYNPLYVTSTVTGKVAIQFSNVDGTLGSIGMVASGTGAYITRNVPSTAATYSVLDTGNFYSLMDSGWLTCAINTSGKFTIYDNGSNIRYRKIGKMVEVVGAVKPKEAIEAGTASYVFGTLPSGYRPSLAITERAQGSGGNSWLFSITTGGELRYSRYSNGSSCILLPAATWLPFHATFFTD